MTDREKVEVKRGLNWTTIALIGGLVLVVLMAVYFSTKGNSNQDKLTEANMSSAARSGDPEKLCATKATYDGVKRELFRRAAQLRGSDQPTFDKLSAYASLRMENPVMESEDEKTGAVNCSASATLELPPGVAVVGGRHSLEADLDYVVQQAADGSGPVVMLRNADPIVSPLATLAKAGEAVSTEDLGNRLQDELAPLGNDQQAAPAPQQPPQPSPAPPVAPRPVGARPSFDCARPANRGEAAVCGDAGLAALDRNMAAQFSRAMAVATPDQQALLRSTGRRFIAYRDRCPNNSCVGDAYTGRMREIRDIMEGRWQPIR